MHGRGHAWQGACMAVGMCDRRGVHGKGQAWRGACMAREMATAADGTHSTGMHSCPKKFSSMCLLCSLEVCSPNRIKNSIF